MYKVIVCFFLLITLQNDTAELSWNVSQPLTWESFRGTPNVFVNAVAVTASGITFSYDIETSSTRGVVSFNTTATAHFYPDKSWYKKHLVNALILEHEQLHFNITELNVRYLREKISTLKPSANIGSILEAYHRTANKELKAMQELYDKESHSSINEVGQEKWNTFVSEELNRLEAFSSKPSNLINDRRTR